MVTIWYTLVPLATIALATIGFHGYHWVLLDTIGYLLVPFGTIPYSSLPFATIFTLTLLNVKPPGDNVNRPGGNVNRPGDNVIPPWINAVDCNRHLKSSRILVA